MGTDLRKLKDRAIEAVEKGKHKKAAELFQELAKADPGEPGWPHRAGELLRKVGRQDEAITWLLLAADGYSRQGFLLKGVAVAKVVLSLAPGHEDAQRLLSELLRKVGKPEAALRPRTIGVEGLAIDLPEEPAPRASPAPPVAPRSLELDPDLPIAALPLGTLMEGARHSPDLPAVPVMEIPLDEDGVEIGDIELPPPAFAPPAAVPPPPPAFAPPVAVPPPPPAFVPPPVAVPPPPPAFVPPPVAVPPPAPPPPAFVPPPVAVPPPAPRPPPARRETAPETEFDAAPSSLVAALDAAEPIVDLPPPAPVLPAIPLFSSLPPAELRCLVQRVQVLEAADGEVLFAEGERGDALFVVVRGAVRLSRGAGRDRVPLERLTEGAFFGEVSLLSQSPRSATAVADGDATLFKLSREVLGEVLHQYPDVLRVLLDFFRTRLVTLLVTTAPLFAPFTPAERERLIRMFRFVEIEAGATVIQQGEPSPGLFILLAGRMDVTAARGGAEVQLAVLGAGDLLGEMSILTRGPAMASIRAAVKCWALLVPRQQFQKLVLAHPQMLDYVADLAEQRRLENDATLAGKRPYGEGRLQVY